MLTGSLSHFSRRHRPLSQIARVIFSLCSFQYVPTILSDMLEKQNMARNRVDNIGIHVINVKSHQLFDKPEKLQQQF